MKQPTYLLVTLFFACFLFACDTPKSSADTETTIEKEEVTGKPMVNKGDCIDSAKVNPGPCTKEYRPVCACNGQTYSNRCLAERAGVTRMAEGSCHECQDASLVGTHSPILRVVKPVCGCNGITYDNESLAKNAGLKSWTAGKCGTDAEKCIDPTKIDPNKGCTREYEPVCGCNGKTYSNKCEAEKAGVTRYTNGECKGNSNTDCVDMKGVKVMDCPENWDPVCGCDGKTYGNECEAKNKGVKTWKKGKCK